MTAFYKHSGVNPTDIVDSGIIKIMLMNIMKVHGTIITTVQPLSVGRQVSHPAFVNYVINLT